VGVLLAAVRVGVLPVTVTAPTCLCAVGLHAGGVEASLCSVLVGVIALRVIPVVGVVAIVGMVAIFMALLTFMAVPVPLGVGVRTLAVRMAFLTVAPAGREREGERGGKKDGEY